MNRVEVKTKAKAQIKGNIGILFLISFIVAAITCVADLLLSFVPMGSLAVSIVLTPAFTLSVIRIFLALINGKKPEVVDTFSGFDDFWSAFKVSFLTGLFTFLWSLLFIIPGIVKSYSYMMAPYVLAENKGKSARECIEESKKMTEGHKMELFILDLSFIGWILLSIITCGIALIWAVPYINAAKANAYDTLKPVVEVPVEEAPADETPAVEEAAESAE